MQEQFSKDVHIRGQEIHLRSSQDGTPDTQMRANQIFTSSLLDDNILVLRPRLPSSLKQVRSVVNLRGRRLPIHVDLSNELKTVNTEAWSLHVELLGNN